MDPRRVPRTVSDPKVRQVGFFTPPDRSQSGPPAPTSSSPPVSDVSPSGNSLSPVMIPPPRHLSTDLSRPFTQAPPLSPLRVVRAADSSVPIGSYNPSEFQSTSVATTEVAEEQLSPNWGRGAVSGKFATSLPAGALDSALVKKNSIDGRQREEMQEEQRAVDEKPLKEKTTKAERRAIQEAQRAAKAAAKGEGNKTSAATANRAQPNTGKSKAISQKKDSSSIAASEKKGSDRQQDKDRKKDVPHPRMQFDDANRVEKAKKRSVVKQTEARNRVELFRHLPQYEHGTRLPDLESKFFQPHPVHPAVYKVGLRYLAGDISGGNARCIAMLQAFQESIKDYSTPSEKTLIRRDLTTKLNGYVSFLIECRPLSISMGNAIRFLKTRIAQLPENLSESEAKTNLISDIDRFINERIILADKVIVKHAVTKIVNGDVLLTYGSSSAVDMILLHAHELGKQFQVVVVDSRPKLEGQKLLRRLLGKGIKCTYTHINAVSYIMHEVTKVLLGASSVLSNGMVYSRVGTACVAMVAHQFRVPVLICCEAYKFHERVQLDSICSNELGDPDVISKVSGRKEIGYLNDWANIENLQLLNLFYDATPSDYISMIVTDYGMIPPTSVPVIVREYNREHLMI
ncbi:probable translation initiation factor eIF-2B subunit delta isoform X2 [Andrographis paniculata]|uniref:probable translation initiation factor eIF-2B subunit delta isoform X2 n=1 Tax=Andrographis paniculata TaxID=175694 RepID=UPI0021E7534C|nr:probable translation initiation factor eIF-2B subunit delta isoform X2 [Andrographis paniculata]